MVAAFVAFIDLQELLQRVGQELAIGGRQADDTMAAGLDGACLMYVDVARVGTDDGFAGGEQRVDDGGVGLCAAREEVNIGIGAAARLANLAPCTFTPFVEAIGEARQRVGIDEVLQHFRMCTVVIIAFKR